MNLLGVVARFTSIGMQVEVLKREALKASVKIVEKRSKEKIGEYQPATGPIPAWTELADSTKEDRVAKGFTENEPLERSGDLRDKITSGIDGDIGYVGSPDLKAMWAEVGTPTEPARSWLEGAYYDKKTEVEAHFGKMVPQIITK